MVADQLLWAPFFCCVFFLVTNTLAVSLPSYTVVPWMLFGFYYFLERCLKSQHYFAWPVLNVCSFLWHPTAVAARELTNTIFKYSLGFFWAQYYRVWGYGPLPIIFQIKIGGTTVHCQYHRLWHSKEAMWLTASIIATWTPNLSVLDHQGRMVTRTWGWVLWPCMFLHADTMQVADNACMRRSCLVLRFALASWAHSVGLKRVLSKRLDSRHHLIQPCTA